MERGETWSTDYVSPNDGQTWQQIFYRTRDGRLFKAIGRTLNQAKRALRRKLERAGL